MIAEPRAIAAAACVGAATLFLWYKLNERSRQTQKRIKDDETYDMVIDICGSPERTPWAVEITKPYEPDVDAVGVCVLGEYKVGKTFLINHLCNLKLCSMESHNTKGLSFKRGREPRNQVVWIDTAGRGGPCDVRKETMEERSHTESLLSEMAYRLADVRIVVVSTCKLRDQEFIFSLHKQIKEDYQPGKDLLIIVHNYSCIGDPRLLEAAFKDDVVQRFNIQEVLIPYRFQATTQKRLWVDRSDQYPVYHLFLGQEGTLAGRKYNEQTFNAIFDLCVDRLGYNIRHNFIDNTIELANRGLLAQHLNCHGQVKYDPASRCIVLADLPVEAPPSPPPSPPPIAPAPAQQFPSPPAPAAMAPPVYNFS